MSACLGGLSSHLQQLSEKLPQSIMYNSVNTSLGSVYLLWKRSWDQVHSAVNCSKKVTAFLKDEVSFSGIDSWGCTQRISQFILSTDRTATFSAKNQRLCTIRWTINNMHQENSPACAQPNQACTLMKVTVSRNVTSCTLHGLFLIVWQILHTFRAPVRAMTAGRWERFLWVVLSIKHK